jgi:ribosomal protein S18 acetylase RimI-like enzyme
VAAVNEALARRVEEAGLNNLHTRRQLLYDGWLLLLLAGKAKRARSVNAHFGSSLPVVDKIAYCQGVYARHGLPTLFRITPFTLPATLDAELGARGFVAFDTTLVQTAELCGPPPWRAGDCELEAPLPGAFVDAVGAMRGSPPSQRSAHLERLAQSPLDVHAVIARRDGKPVGAGLLAIDGELAGVYDVVTVPRLRGQRIATGVVCALLAHAWERGARHAFLQVTESNLPALALYRRFGFSTLYRYHYRARPEDCE